MRIIIVEWHDAGSAHTIEEAKHIIRRSVGYEVENKVGEGVTLSMEPDQLSGVHFIPWAMVKQVIPIGTSD